MEFRRGRMDVQGSPASAWITKGIAMLVLNRKLKEEIIIGDDIRIVLVDVRRDGSVRIGVDAPKELSVHRKEVYDAIQRERKQGNG